MTLSEACASARHAIARLKELPDAGGREIAADAERLLDIIKPGRHSEDVAITDTCFMASQLNELADGIAGDEWRTKA